MRLKPWHFKLTKHKDRYRYNIKVGSINLNYHYIGICPSTGNYFLIAYTSYTGETCKLKGHWKEFEPALCKYFSTIFHRDIIFSKTTRR